MVMPRTAFGDFDHEGDTMDVIPGFAGITAHTGLYKEQSMPRSFIGLTLFAFAGVMSAQTTDIATVIKRVSENCDKIESFTAKLDARYHD